MERLSGFVSTVGKVRVRSLAELQDQRELLCRLAVELEKEEYPYFLASGTLLGIYRDGDLIPWDWDLQLYFRTEDLLPRLSDFVYLLQQAGLQVELSEVREATEEIKVLAFQGKIKLEVTSWTRRDQFRIRRAAHLPSHLFENTSDIEFAGTRLRTFRDPEEVLRLCYGDWRTPIRTAHKKTYLSSDFFQADETGRSGRLFREYRRFFGRLRARAAMKLVSRKRGKWEKRRAELPR